jgi:hypothetical protein
MSQVQPKFKLLQINSSPHYQGFGFKINQKVKPKYTVIDVVKNSPADMARLEKMDVIIEINGKNIRRSSFKKVGNYLSNAIMNGEVELLVINQEGYLWFKRRGKRFSSKFYEPCLNQNDLHSNIKGPFQSSKLCFDQLKNKIKKR